MRQELTTSPQLWLLALRTSTEQMNQAQRDVPDGWNAKSSPVKICTKKTKQTNKKNKKWQSFCLEAKAIATFLWHKLKKWRWVFFFYVFCLLLFVISHINHTMVLNMNHQFFRAHIWPHLTDVCLCRITLMSFTYSWHVTRLPHHPSFLCFSSISHFQIGTKYNNVASPDCLLFPLCC